MLHFTAATQNMVGQIKKKEKWWNLSEVGVEGDDKRNSTSKSAGGREDSGVGVGNTHTQNSSFISKPMLRHNFKRTCHRASLKLPLHKIWFRD